jgi:ubiquinone/menaquinone biosynthesis C-methylase UbiE
MRDLRDGGCGVDTDVLERGYAVNAQKRDFDKVAASWDQNPMRLKLAEDVARAIARQILLTRDMDVLDFGCGTGLLTLQLQPKVRSIIGVDSSEGMLAVLWTKIARANLKNVDVAHIDLDRGQSLPGRYDLIVSSMTLHHILDVGRLLAQFRRIIKPGGWLCIADLDSDGGRFHEDSTGVFHPGFDRSALSSAFEAAGFHDARSVTAAEIVKPAPGGGATHFTVFLMTGRIGAFETQV